MKRLQTTCSKCTTRGQSVFCDLNDQHLRELDTAKTTNQYKMRQVIFYEGNNPTGLYCIATGKVKIYKSDANGHQQIVRLAGSGDILGYRCLLGNEPYSATAETIEDSQICFVDKKTFFHLLETHPATAFNVMRTLSRDLGRAEELETNLVHKNVRERLAELLLVFKERFGKKDSKGVKLDISLTREELAQLVGTTQESVIRLITEFKNDGLIEVNGREVTLLNINRLTDTAGIVD
ncbi:MAG: Crp/Fnr family transcriptional regulator [Deltaproteobacteria bacterium]|nr:Crp/Fnr family transcriptional regulator [Deltaproteobacteria bacterium]